MGNVSQEIEILKKNQKEILEIKNINRNEKMPLVALLVDGHR